jgi:DNA-directed RNA polymerase sigma subunit (sigma70/sigma32)
MFLFLTVKLLYMHRLLTAREEAVAGQIANLDHNAANFVSIVSQKRDHYLAETARQVLVKHNIRFAEKMTIDIIRNSYWASKVPRATLRNEAILGLVAASQKYDGRIRFASFAGVYVRDNLLRAITRRRQELGYVLNHKESLLLNRVKKTRFRLKMGLEEREPTDEEVATAVGVSSRRIAKLVEKEKIRIISGVDTEFFDKYVSWSNAKIGSHYS